LRGAIGIEPSDRKNDAAERGEYALIKEKAKLQRGPRIMEGPRVRQILCGPRNLQQADGQSKQADPAGRPRQLQASLTGFRLDWS